MKSFTMTRTPIFLLIGAAMICMFATTPQVLAGQSRKSRIASSEKTAGSDKAVPEAVFLEKRYETAPVMEGAEIKHDFVIENHGNAPLVIQKVRPG